MARGYGLTLDEVLRREMADDVQIMGRHLAPLQYEEADLLASLIADRIAAAALRLLVDIGLLQKAEGTETDPDGSPEEVELLRKADVLIRRHCQPSKKRR